MTPLTARDVETLGELAAANRNHKQVGFLGGWARVMDCGGTDSSHHGATLKKLRERGLCERKGWRGGRRTNLYRITAEGRAVLGLSRVTRTP